MDWRPWAAQSVKAAIQYRIWVPIVGCHACEEDAAGPRQRGRPRKHNEVCRLRQADLALAKEMQRRPCHIPRRPRRRLPQAQQVQPRAQTPRARSARQKRPGRRRRMRRVQETCQNFAQQKFFRDNHQLSASAGSPTRRRRECSCCPARQQRSASPFR